MTVLSIVEGYEMVITIYFLDNVYTLEKACVLWDFTYKVILLYPESIDNIKAVYQNFLQNHYLTLYVVFNLLW